MGSDAALLPLVSSGLAGGQDQQLLRQTVQRQVDAFSRKGLRTMVQVMRVIEPADVDDVMQRLRNASITVGDRKSMLADEYATLERDFVLLGATAVEDKLQPGVEAAMRHFREAGICLWVLTGDKVETAINISLSSGHFTHNTYQLMAVGLDDSAACMETLQAHRNHCLSTANTGTHRSQVSFDVHWWLY